MRVRHIYVLKCPKSGCVRYVGQAMDLKSRLRQHISESKIGKVRSHKCAWIRSLLKEGLRPIMEIDVCIISGQCWKSVEIERVAHYRSIGCDLTNSTDGGDAPGELSEAGRQILSDRASVTFGSPEGRIRQSKLMKELCRSDEWRKARDESAKATRSTAEYKARMSIRSKAHWQNPEYRENASRKRRELCQDPSFIAKLSSAIKAAQSSDEARKKKSDQMKAVWAARHAAKGDPGRDLTRTVDR